MERIELKEKHWKHKDGDWDTREKYDEYLAVYEKILNTCNVVPCISCLRTRTGRSCTSLQISFSKPLKAWILNGLNW